MLGNHTSNTYVYRGFCICDGPVAAIGLIYIKMRTSMQGLEMMQTIGGFLSPCSSNGPTERGKGHDPDREMTYDWAKQLGRFTAKKIEI